MPSSANGSSSEVVGRLPRGKWEFERGDGPASVRRNGAELLGELGFDPTDATGTTSPRAAPITVRLTPVTIVGDSYSASIAELAVESMVEVVKSVRCDGA